MVFPPPEPVLTSAERIAWDIYTYPPEYYATPYARNPTIHFNYMAGAELCAGYIWLTDSVHSLWPKLPDAKNIPTGSTYARELMKAEQAMVANGTLTAGYAAAIFVIKAFAFLVTIEEKGAFGSTLKGYGTNYLSKALFDPNFVFNHTSTDLATYGPSIAKTWKPAGEAFHTIFMRQNGVVFAAWYGGNELNKYSVGWNNWNIHLNGAMSSVPFTGYTQAAIDTFATLGLFVTALRDGAVFDTVWFAAQNRYVPRTFETCLSAINFHDFLYMFETGGTTLLCSNRGSAAIKALQTMLDYELAIKAYLSPGPGMPEQPGKCAGMPGFMTMEELREVLRKVEFWTVLGGARKIAAYNNQDGGPTFGNPVFDEIDYARIVDMYLIPQFFHMKVINNLCTDVKYEAVYPPPYFFYPDTFANTGVTPVDPATYVQDSNRFGWFPDRRIVSYFTQSSDESMWDEAQQAARCFADWSTYTAKAPFTSAPTLTDVNIDTNYCNQQFEWSANKITN